MRLHSSHSTCSSLSRSLSPPRTIPSILQTSLSIPSTLVLLLGDRRYSTYRVVHVIRIAPVDLLTLCRWFKFVQLYRNFFFRLEQFRKRRLVPFIMFTTSLLLLILIHRHNPITTEQHLPSQVDLRACSHCADLYLDLEQVKTELLSQERYDLGDAADLNDRVWRLLDYNQLKVWEGLVVHGTCDLHHNVRWCCESETCIASVDHDWRLITDEQVRSWQSLTAIHYLIYYSSSSFYYNSPLHRPRV